MPSTKNTMPLLGGRYYHIFNKGISDSKIFFQPKNYQYLLDLLNRRMLNSVEVLAYCLITNHFHLLIRLKDEVEIAINKREDSIPLEGCHPLSFKQTKTLRDEETVGRHVSEQFRRLFISFSQAINRQEERSGSLFIRNFKRLPVENDDYLKYLFFYIHYNPQKHGLTSDFTQYRYSSYQSYICSKPTLIARTHGIELFGRVDEFRKYHSYFHDEKGDLHLE